MNHDNFLLITQRVVQNNQEFLIGVFDIQDILKFTRYTEYTILGFDEENDNKPITKEEVQRKLIPSKVNSIVDFLINDPLAIFPTNLVISIPNHVIAEQNELENTGIVEIKLDEKVFREIEKRDSNLSGDVYLSIIDGQHRIRGIEKTISVLNEEIETTQNFVRSTRDPAKYVEKIVALQEKLESIKKIQLAVTFFIDPVLEYQAMIFSTINRTQTKVPPDLVYSLFGLTKGDSPQKTVLNIVNTLNGKVGSPFYKRIRLAGAGTKEAKSFYKEGNPVLSQATVVQAIIKLICKNKREEEIARHKNREYFLKESDKSLPFRKYYGQDMDSRILRILYSFFSAVKNTFTSPDGISIWEFEDKDTTKPRNILQTTIGFIVLLDILKYILNNIKEDENDKISTYEEYLKKARSIDFVDDNSPKKYPFANKTKNVLYNEIGQLIFGVSFPSRN